MEQALAPLPTLSDPPATAALPTSTLADRLAALAAPLQAATTDLCGVAPAEYAATPALRSSVEQLGVVFADFVRRHLELDPSDAAAARVLAAQPEPAPPVTEATVAVVPASAIARTKAAARPTVSDDVSDAESGYSEDGDDASAVMQARSTAEEVPAAGAASPVEEAANVHATSTDDGEPGLDSEALVAPETALEDQPAGTGDGSLPAAQTVADVAGEEEGMPAAASFKAPVDRVARATADSSGGAAASEVAASEDGAPAAEEPQLEPPSSPLTLQASVPRALSTTLSSVPDLAAGTPTARRSLTPASSAIPEAPEPEAQQAIADALGATVSGVPGASALLFASSLFSEGDDGAAAHSTAGGLAQASSASPETLLQAAMLEAALSGEHAPAAQATPRSGLSLIHI